MGKLGGYLGGPVLPFAKCCEAICDGKDDVEFRSPGCKGKMHSNAVIKFFFWGEDRGR